jgi:hypothetical protein
VAKVDPEHSQERTGSTQLTRSRNKQLATRGVTLTNSLGTHYLADAVSSLRAYKKLADKAITQLKDGEIFQTLDEEGNSVAVIMKHLAGNMFSRGLTS